MPTPNGAPADDRRGASGGDGTPDDDEARVRALWGAPAAEEAPPEVRRAARAAYAHRRPDAALADLTGDSVFAGGTRTGTAGGPRYLTYRAGGVAIRIEVTEHDRARSLVGQVTPMGPAAVTVHWQRGRRAAEVDSAGAFVAEGVPSGPISLTVERAGERPIATCWTAV